MFNITIYTCKDVSRYTILVTNNNFKLFYHIPQNHNILPSLSLKLLDLRKFLSNFYQTNTF